MSEPSKEPPRLVVDASVVVKWYVPEIHWQIARQLLNDENQLFAPDLIWAELGNVVTTLTRTGRMSTEIAQEVFRAFARVPLQIHAVKDLHETAFEAARDTGRSFYDCAYLALARQTGSLLVTADLRFYNGIKNTPWARYCIWLGDVA